ncbi:hypothetical protein CR513_56471, partial [Mucuna pruriens]
MNKIWMINDHNKTFLHWFKEQILNDDTASKTLNNTGVQTNELGFALVDLDKVRRSMHESDENQNASLDISDTSSFSTCMSTLNEENDVDDVYVTLHDHKKLCSEPSIQRSFSALQFLFLFVPSTSHLQKE